MSEQDLSERYGAPPRRTRWILIGVSVLLATAFGGWVAWVSVAHGDPPVSSELVRWEVVDDHEATATVRVNLDDGVRASCRVRALAEDHAVVGERAFTPRDGVNDVRIRTERRATAVMQVGCTAPGLHRPR